MGIKFGTSGWRGILAEDFTFPNARLVCQAIADYLHGENLGAQGVVVGHDTRFLSEAFANVAVEVMAGNGIKSFITDRDAPTPVVSHAIIKGHCAGGINITASHNPAEYNGLKFNPIHGGPAPEPVTAAIEALIRGMRSEDVRSLPFKEARQQGWVADFNPRGIIFSSCEA